MAQLGRCFGVLFGLTALLAGCSGGGGGGSVRVGFTSNAASLLEDGSNTALVVELELAEGSLEEELTVGIRDKGSGSASSGVDYVAFAEATLTFATGAVDGTSQTVSLTSITDSLVEGTETIVLELFQASGGKISTGSVTVSINDDDVPGALVVAANPGTGPVALPIGSTIDFGAQNVADGPTDEVVVILENDGDSIVNLSAVTLLGSDQSEFSVTVDAEPGTGGGVAGLPAPLARRESPLFALGPETQSGLRLVLDDAVLAELATLDAVQLEGWALPGEGEVTLDLERVPSPWSAEAEVRLDGQHYGSARELSSGVSMWRGSVAGRPGSSAFLGFSSLGSRGWLRLSDEPEDFFYVSAETSIALTPGGAESRIARPAQLDPLGSAALGTFCQGVRRVPDAEPPTLDLPPSDGLPTTAEMPATPLLLPAVCRVAFETDFQFWNHFGDTNAAVVYVTQLLAAINEQYTKDIQTELVSVYISFYSGPVAELDPWDASDNPATMTAEDLLNEFEEQWSPASGAPLAPDLDYDIAHFLSGAELGGGIAYVDALCHPNFNLGVSTEMTGTIDFNTFSGTPDNMNWDFVVVAHEIGHNFGAEHTHDYCPPLDRCQTPTGSCVEPVACSNGTLMSYCHLCAGATGNIDLEFHPVIADIMREAVNGSCLTRSGLPGGASVGFRVRFDPASTGLKEASLRFTHDAQNLSTPFSIGLEGTGQ